MKLSRLDIATVAKAVRVYLDLAYGSGVQPRKVPDLSLPADADAERVLGLFHRESVDEGGRRTQRYSLRLGNRNYPFMKLVLLEHLLPGEFIFAVDTHDEMDIKPDFPDYEAWVAVCRFNRSLKEKIEKQFAAEGLDTSATLRRMAAQQERAAGTGQRLLVVDDEEDLARSVESLLSCRGYDVRVASDGARALDAIRDVLPDLVLLDYEMPEMDGLEVIAAMRRDPATRDIPVLLATAGHIELEDIRKADGFLAKPFPAPLLFEMVARLLGARRSDAGTRIR